MNLLKNPAEWSNGYWWPPCMPNPKLVDFYDDKVCYIWYLFVEEGADLDLEECANEEQGQKPEWLEEEIGYAGTNIYEMGTWSMADHSIGRHAEWGLENGIAPYQPFRIRVEPPHYYSCSWEYPNEVDVEWTWWVDLVMKISDFDASRRWEHWLAEHKLHFEYIADHQKWINNILDHTVEWMYLDWDLYQTGRGHGYPVTGTMVSLRAGGWIEGRYEERRYGCGRSDKGDRKEALKEMLREVKPKLPHLHGNKIRNMATQPAHRQYAFQIR